MVKVYDMVTFGVSEPDTATPMQDDTPALQDRRDHPELGLQLIERTAEPQHSRQPAQAALAEAILKHWDKA